MIILDYGIIFFTIFLFEQYGYFLFYPIVAWIIGAKQYSIGEVLLHEASHRQLFSNRKLNNYFDLILAYPFMTSTAYYRAEHIRHHKFLGTSKDPLINRIASYKIEKGFLWYHWFIKPFLFGFVFFTLKNWVKHWRDQRLCGSYLFWVTVLIISISYGWFDLFLFYWVIPLLWSFSSFVFWSEITEHYGCDGDSRSYENTFSNLFISHNAGYHKFHHLKPDVPFYLLKREAKKYHQQPEIISKSFLETYNQIRQFQMRASNNV